MEDYYNLIKSTPVSELKTSTEGKSWEYIIIHKIPTDPYITDHFRHSFHFMHRQYIVNTVLADPSISHDKITDLLRKYELSHDLARVLCILKYSDYNKVYDSNNQNMHIIKATYLETMINSNEFDFELLHKSCAWNTPKVDFANSLLNDYFGSIKDYVGWEKADYTSLPSGYQLNFMTVNNICSYMSADKIISNFKQHLIQNEYFMKIFMERKHIILDEFKEKIPLIICKMVCGNKENITKEDFEQWQLESISSNNEVCQYDVRRHPAIVYAKRFNEPPPIWMITSDVFDDICQCQSLEAVVKTICANMDADQIISTFMPKLISSPYFMVRFMRTKHILLEQFTNVIPPFICNLLCGFKDRITEEEYNKWNASKNIIRGLLIAHPIVLYIKSFHELPPRWMITSSDSLNLIRNTCTSEGVDCPKYLYMTTNIACEHYDAEEFYTDSIYREVKCKNCWSSLEGLHRVYNIKCPICFNDNPSSIVVLRNCHHSICTECIDLYLDNDDKCAICRCLNTSYI